MPDYYRIDLSGNTVTASFQKLAKLTIFDIFNELLLPQIVNVARFARCCKMRLFLWFSNTVQVMKRNFFVIRHFSFQSIIGRTFTRLLFNFPKGLINLVSSAKEFYYDNLRFWAQLKWKLHLHNNPNMAIYWTDGLF